LLERLLRLLAADSRYWRTGHCCDPTDQYKKALVSILIPANNAEECVASAIGSALGQTWRQKEIIVVDDNSADGLWQSRGNLSRMKFGWQRSRIKGRRPPCVPSAGDTANPDELLRGCGAWGRRFAAKNHSANSSRCSYFFHVIFHLNIHSFGPLVIATDACSLRHDIVEAKTGFLCRAKNPG
jgi:cellulose synthase/poly-beta-1,6-N-acetylglucosamine synthase-like glycosyltransferase